MATRYGYSCNAQRVKVSQDPLLKTGRICRSSGTVRRTKLETVENIRRLPVTRAKLLCRFSISRQAVFKPKGEDHTARAMAGLPLIVIATHFEQLKQLSNKAARRRSNDSKQATLATSVPAAVNQLAVATHAAGTKR